MNNFELAQADVEFVLSLHNLNNQFLPTVVFDAVLPKMDKIKAEYPDLEEQGIVVYDAIENILVDMEVIPVNKKKYHNN